MSTAEMVPVGEVARGLMQESPIRSSQTLGKLATALAAAQAKFPSISKDRTASVASKKGEQSSYSYSYADLADVLSAVRPHLAEVGLATLQPLSWNGEPRLITRLIHSSGEWIESEYRLTEYERPQDMGSAITYARRYALTALLGIAAEEDDDGQRAQVGPQRGRQAMPSCPTCGTPERVIVSKFGPGFYCHTCKGKFADPAEQSRAHEAREAADNASEYPPEEEYPHDPTAHERHQVEPARQPERHTSPPERPACPTCNSDRRVGPSKFPKKGRFYCGACAKPFGEPA